jgi:hypothetical protein
MAAPASDRRSTARRNSSARIAAAERAGPSPNVHPRVHEAMRSELAVLREQLDDSQR